jgi:bifunctional DNA-binding transcriptional regulator/antitoxin component of YhaV-PrlF toxin-antitoxin module
MNDKIQDESVAYFHYYNEFELVRKETTLTQSGKKFQNSRDVIFSRPNLESKNPHETAIVKYNEEEDFYYLESDVFEQVGWKPGDDIIWIENEDGSFTLRKEENIMNNQKDVTEFMAAADQYVGTTPHLNEKNEQQARLYIDLIDEEFRELCDGFLRRHIGDIADGGADLVWVVQGLFITLGIDFDKVWKEVRASNMSKVSDNGKIKKREDGKILKPESYFKPDIERVLKEQGL